MKSPLTFHSYMKPATSPQVPKMRNDIQNFCYFFISLNVTRFIFHRIPLKRAIVELLRRIWNTSSEASYWYWVSHEAVGEQNVLLSTFFHRFGTFSIFFRGKTDIALDVHCGSAGFILTTWTLFSCEIVKLKLMKYIPQQLKFPVFVLYQSAFIISHQHTNIMTWNKGNNTGKIFISNIKYLKMVTIYSSTVNIKISVKFPLIWLCQVFHWSGGKSYFDMRMISKLLWLHSNAHNFI